jgi:hypothetical protein
MVRPFSMPMAPVMPFRRLHLSCLLRGSNRIRIQQRSGFSTLGRTGQKNKQANNQGAEYYLDVHRRLPPSRLSRLRSAIDLRLLPRYHDVGPSHILPHRPPYSNKSRAAATTANGVEDPNGRSITSTNSVGKRLLALRIDQFDGLSSGSWPY